MAEKKEDTEIKKLEEMLKAIKFGDMFLPSQFESAEKASQFINAFAEKLPIVDEKDIKAAEEQIKKTATVKELNTQQIDNADTQYFGALPIADAINHFIPLDMYSCVDNNGKPWYPEFEKAHEKKYAKGLGREAPNDPPMPREVQEACYPFMIEWRKLALNGEREKARKLKTPYEKLPLKTRLAYRIKKTLKMKTDQSIKLMDDASFALKHDRELYLHHDGTWNIYYIQKNTTAKKYFEALLDQPYDRMVAQLNKDMSLADKTRSTLYKRAQKIEADLTNQTSQRDKLLKINELCSEIVNSMTEKSTHYFQIRTHAHDARIHLAQKGMMNNDDVKEPTVSGVVANERVTKAKEKGSKLDWSEAKKRHNR